MEQLLDIAVIGAGGKMGRGIALLLLQEIAMLSDGHILRLIDLNDKALKSLMGYLRTNMRKRGEKQINALRKWAENAPSLVSNEEVIDAWVNGALEKVHLSNCPEEAARSRLVFEAAVEDEEVKAELLGKVEQLTEGKPYYFTNTSSIPIYSLNEKAGLENRVIGFHFYNPPAVQKLLEVIPPDNVEPELIAIAETLAKRLGKTTVFSRDVAGFIGNGYLMREIVFACSRLESQSPEAIFAIDYATREFLIRPMGIFQLLDYVGIDVCGKILGVMRKYLEEPLPAPLIPLLLERGIKGGQYPDGSQRDGIFQYEKGVPVKVYDLEEGGYIPIEEEWAFKLGMQPEGHFSWKEAKKEKLGEEAISRYLEELFQTASPGAELAKTYLLHSREIARTLVEQGIARSIEDVDKVLTNGFYHLYGKLPEEVAAQ